MSQTLVLDVETTTYNKGHPYDPRNVLCLVGIVDLNTGEYIEENIEYTPNNPYGPALQRIQELLDEATLVIGFNIKFDIVWLRNYGINYFGPLWDLQYGEYLLSHQRLHWGRNSLNACCERLGLGQKLELPYWDEGYDTRDIPLNELSEYLKTDCVLTGEAYLHQVSQITDAGMYPVMTMHMEDLHNIIDIEYNGLKYDRETGKKRLAKLQELQESLEQKIRTRLKLPPEYRINFSSPEHISALLFGGIIKAKWKEPYETIPKSGPMKGQTVIKNKHYTEEYPVSRIMKPLKANKKDGIYSTDKWTLNTLKHQNKKYKELIDDLLLYSTTDQMLSTYYLGYEKLFNKYHWNDEVLHGQINQNRTRTGRTSSDQPNQQNIPPEVRELIGSHYE